MKSPGLSRALTLVPATAINLIDMVGIGPFVTLSFIVGAMQGPACLWAWLLGAALALLDGAVWSELGAKWPEAGGSYAFLQRLWPAPWGRFLAFLFILQTTIQAPLVVASGAIGFAKYASFLLPLSTLEGKAVSGGIVLLIVFLLYRRIGSVGKLSLWMGGITLGTLLGIIVVGLFHFNPANFSVAQLLPKADGDFWQSLGNASQKTIYCYLGYYNVCHLGAEIKNPQRVIPRSMFISIGLIAVLYLGMQIAVLGVLPWQEIAGSDFVISLYINRLFGAGAAQMVTGFILLIAISSLFAVLLGYSRVLYAAAADGNFFAPFAKLHPKHQFPHISLLVLGGIAFVFSLLFRMGEVISAIIVLRILVQFVCQTAGLIYWHTTKPKDERPWKMYLYPLAPALSICIWLFVFVTSKIQFIAGAFGLIALGTILYFTVINRQLGNTKKSFEEAI